MYKGHLITCLSIDEIRRFEEELYIGLGPFYPREGSTNRQIGSRLRILWDVIADLKRVQPGDICFFHANGLIFGPYIIKSTFRESLNLPEILKSTNLSYENWIERREEFSDLNINEYGYIASIEIPDGCNRDGIDLMELFLRQSLGIFNGIPPRFMYGDTKKIVKPLLYHELKQLLQIVGFEESLEFTIVDLNEEIDTLDEISLNLTSYNGHLYSEKLLEAWIIQNISANGDHYNELTDLFGNFNYYANSIFTYYTNFLDVIAYNIHEEYDIGNCPNCSNIIRNFANNIKVVELKRDRINNLQTVITQIRNYIRWAQTILNPNTDVTGYIIANGFQENIDQYRQENLFFIRYSIENTSLTFEIL